jgi:hypothetical protein
MELIKLSGQSAHGYDFPFNSILPCSLSYTCLSQRFIPLRAQNTDQRERKTTLCCQLLLRGTKDSSWEALVAHRVRKCTDDRLRLFCPAFETAPRPGPTTDTASFRRDFFSLRSSAELCVLQSLPNGTWPTSKLLAPQQQCSQQNKVLAWLHLQN